MFWGSGRYGDVTLSGKVDRDQLSARVLGSIFRAEELLAQKRVKTTGVEWGWGGSELTGDDGPKYICFVYGISHRQKDGQCMYNATTRRVCVTSVTREKQLLLHVLRAFLYSCILSVLFRIVICGLSGSTVFYHIISLNGKIFGKTLSNIKFVPWFSL